MKAIELVTGFQKYPGSRVFIYGEGSPIIGAYACADFLNTQVRVLFENGLWNNYSADHSLVPLKPIDGSNFLKVDYGSCGIESASKS